MPMHDWTAVDAGTYHDFHQVWTVEIRNRLNRGLLPPGYYAMADQRVGGPEPDVVTFHNRYRRPGPAGGTAVADEPVRSTLTARGRSPLSAYARKANRISVRDAARRVVAVIEVVSPGNKDRELSVGNFARKLGEYLDNGVHVLLIDPFPPGPHDTDGLHAAVWNKISREQMPPSDRPLVVAAFESGDEYTAYVEPFAVGDAVPATPLFIEPGRYVTVPLDETYAAAWDNVPVEIQELLVPPTS